jgi:hypothetical protein
MGQSSSAGYVEDSKSFIELKSREIISKAGSMAAKPAKA